MLSVPHFTSRVTGLCTLERAPRERPVDEHWARDWLVEWTHPRQTHGGVKWAPCKGDEAPGSCPCQNRFIFELSGNWKKGGKHHIHVQKETKTLPHTHSSRMPGTSGVCRVSAGTCSLPRAPRCGGGDGNVLSPRPEISPGWEEHVLHWRVTEDRPTALHGMQQGQMQSPDHGEKDTLAITDWTLTGWRLFYRKRAGEQGVEHEPAVPQGRGITASCTATRQNTWF